MSSMEERKQHFLKKRFGKAEEKFDPLAWTKTPEYMSMKKLEALALKESEKKQKYQLLGTAKKNSTMFKVFVYILQF